MEDKESHTMQPSNEANTTTSNPLATRKDIEPLLDELYVEDLNKVAREILANLKGSMSSRINII